MSEPAAAGPPRAHLVLLFAVSGSMLAFEVLLVRLFEYSHWHHFAGLSLSLALLGLGTAGTVLALRGGRRPGDGLPAVGAAIQALGILAVLALHSRIALRPLFAAWDAGELGRLLVVDFAAFVPFFGAGLVIGQIFMLWPAASRRIYAVNLLGSGAGSLAASALLAVMTVEHAVALAALPPALALAALAPGWARRGGVALCVVAVAAALYPPAPAVSDFKSLSGVLEPADARLLSTRAGLEGRLSVVRSASQRHAPGLSLRWAEPVPASDAVVIGSDKLVPMPRTFPGDTAHWAASLTGLPLQMRPSGAVLVVGTSAWQSQVAAASRRMTWVESDRRLHDLAVQRGLSGASSVLVEDSAYRYLTAARTRFELITLDAAFAGGDAASEDYLMTAEGLAAALKRLAPEGLLAIPLRLSVPPRRAARAFNTVRQALAGIGVREPARHIAALRGLQELLVLVSPQPLAEPDIRGVRRFSERWRFDLVWLPGLREHETNRYHRLDGPVFFHTARAVVRDRPLPPAARWFTSAAADSWRPYFWRSLEWERIPDFVEALGRQRALSYLDWTLLLSAVSAGLAALLGLVLIVAPLGRLPELPGSRGRVMVAAYFGALGLGYLLVELVAFQRGILFLGEPVTTAAMVFALFLVGSGLGSAGAPLSPGAPAVRRIFLPIAAGLSLGALVLWPLADWLLRLPWPARAAFLAAALLPLAWAMGRAFPWALRQLAGHDRWVPWAWAINGFASVVAAALASLVSVQWGQPATLGVAVACYALAGIIARLEWGR